MGLRFRKSIKIAPGLKINLNKKSASVTFGTKGAHYTINSKGKRTASIGIPGTGISYTTTIDNKKKSQPKNKTHINSQNKKSILILIFILLITIFSISSIKKHTKTNSTIVTDMEILQIKNHPKFYGNYETAKKVWSPYKNVAVVNARQTIYNEDALLLVTTGDSDNNYITSIVIDFRNSSNHANYSLDDMLYLTCEYLPFDILNQYYIFADSFKESTSDNIMDSYYYIYELNSDGVDYNIQDNNLYLESKLAFNIKHYLAENQWSIEINYLSSKSNTDKFSNDYFSREDWKIDLNSYR